MGQELQHTVNVLVVDHAKYEMEFFVVHLSQLLDNFGDAGYVVPSVGDGQRVSVENLPATHEVGVADYPADTVADVVFREVELVAKEVKSAHHGGEVFLLVVAH